MTDTECLGRLTSSATHDLRNVLAVIRESTGLVQDILNLADPAQQESKQKRIQQALLHVQEQVNHGAKLAEGMGYLGQCGEYADDAPSNSRTDPCDLGRITRDFCTMAARRGNVCSLKLHCHSAAEPILSPLAPLEVFRALLDIFDACVSVGGGVCLHFTPLRRPKGTAILCAVQEGGENTDMVVAALTGHPMLRPNPPGWAEKWLPGFTAKGPRFLLQWDHDGLTS